jgi:hypothetical protein
MTTPTMTWTRLTRRLRGDGNPLRRRSDVAQAWLLPGAIGAFLVLGPLVAVASLLIVSAGNAAEHRADRSLHPVAAVLLAATPGPMVSASGANSWLSWARARWTAGGTARSGLVPVRAGTRAGAAVQVWLDRAGRVRLPPLTAGMARDRIRLTMALALTVLAAFLTGVTLVARWLLNRRQLAGWAAAWRVVEPQWSSLE